MKKKEGEGWEKGEGGTGRKDEKYGNVEEREVGRKEEEGWEVETNENGQKEEEKEMKNQRWKDGRRGGEKTKVLGTKKTRVKRAVCLNYIVRCRRINERTEE